MPVLYILGPIPREFGGRWGAISEDRGVIRPSLRTIQVHLQAVLPHPAPQPAGLQEEPGKSTFILADCTSMTLGNFTCGRCYRRAIIKGEWLIKNVFIIPKRMLINGSIYTNIWILK